jgi:Protein of unknown function (DUF2924)
VRARRRLRTSLSEALIVPPTAEDGFEYEGQRYRSLTVIAEQITGGTLVGPAVLWREQASACILGGRGRPIKKPETRTRRNGTVRCAIYTRKSSEEGLPLLGLARPDGRVG